MDGCIVRVQRIGSRVEITLGPGFTRADLAWVKALPGRHWNPERRTWIAPHGAEVAVAARLHFGEDRVHLTRSPPPDPAEEFLERVREGLLLRGYSPHTRKVYLGHLRRFLTWCARRPEGRTHAPPGADPADAPGIAPRRARGVHFIHVCVESGHKEEWVDARFDPPGSVG